jgi:hypothetical protein
MARTESESSSPPPRCIVCGAVAECPGRAPQRCSERQHKQKERNIAAPARGRESQDRRTRRGQRPGASKRRRSPEPARRGWELRAWLLLAYPGHYVRQHEFRLALLALYEERCAGREQVVAEAPDLWDIHDLTWQPGSEADRARASLAAVKRTAARFGLDRLGRPRASADGEFSPSRGEQFVHRWCRSRVRALRSGKAWPPENVTLVIRSGGALPSVGGVVSVEHQLGDDAGDRGEPARDERREPRVHVLIEDAWDPRSEAMVEAERRLSKEAGRQIKAELERIAADAEERGYEFPDTTPKAGQHLRWLCEPGALGKSYGQIAQGHLGGRDLAPSVYNRVKPYADLLGIALGRDQ